MNDNKSTFLAVGALLAIAGSLTFLYFSQFGGGSKMSLKPMENLGLIVAEETAKLLSQPGPVVIVAEVEETRSLNTEALIKGFKAGLAKQTGVTLKAIEDLKRSMDGDPRLWPAGHAEQLSKLGVGGGAVVFIGGLPQELTKDDLAALKASKSKLIFVTAQAPTLKPLLQQGLVQLAVVNRFPPKPALSRKESPRQWFDRVYLVAKPNALGELP